MVAKIEYIEEVIEVCRQAAEANRRTPSRSGNVIVLTPEVADEVLITADLHGHRRNFTLIRRLADLEAHPRRHLVLQEVCHGGPTYGACGGCMSHTMLEDVARLKVQYPERVHFLLSNHEWAELLDYPIRKNEKLLNLLFRLGLQEMYGAASESVRQAYLEFIRTCPLAMRLPGGVFICHSAPEGVDRRRFDAGIFERDLQFEDFREQGDVYHLLWGRDYRPENARAFARLVGARVLIHGHEPCPEGYHVPNDVQIILDCCGDNACYVLLAVGPEYTQQQVIERIRPLK